MRILIVHDTRSVGFLTSVVLYRVLRRCGHGVQAVFGHEETREPDDFWPRAAALLPLAEADRLLLVGMTFDRTRAEECTQRLRWLSSQVSGELEVWSHRWPDGYEGLADVRVPPYEVTEVYANDLYPVERRLLTLALIVSRQMPESLVDPDEQRVAYLLDVRLTAAPQETWDRLCGDPEACLQELESSSAHSQAVEGVEILGRDTQVLHVALDHGLHGHCEKTLERVLLTEGMPEGIAVGKVDRGEGAVDLYLVRRGGQTHLPSLRWLIGQLGPEYALPRVDRWLGPGDAPHVSLSPVEMAEHGSAAFEQRACRFAEAAASVTTGERGPDPMLTKHMVQAARQALADLDLLGRYTREDGVQLEVPPELFRLLLGISDRTGNLRRTLVVPIHALTPEAAAFLFAGGGYNLLKTERLLEGALLGLRAHPSVWLGADELPSRLRIDVTFEPQAARRLPDLLKKDRPTRTVPLTDALRSGALVAGSNVAHALERYGVERLVVYRESETIGPSVPYAFMIAAVAGQVGRLAARRVRVQDLFAGSGLASLAAVKSAADVSVHAVDFAISRDEASPADEADVLWLRADVRDAIGGPSGILTESYDVVGLDPPHAAIFDLLFEVPEGSDRTVLDHIATNCDWLVVYQGHQSQQGRGAALASRLTSSFERVSWWDIGHETLLLCGPQQTEYCDWDRMLADVEHFLHQECAPYGWRVAHRRWRF